MDASPFSNTQIRFFAHLVAQAAHVPDAEVIFHSHALAIGGTDARQDRSVAFAAALLADSALAVLSDGDTFRVEAQGLSRGPKDGPPVDAGSWSVTVACLHRFDAPRPDSVRLDAPVAGLRPFLSEAINEVPGVLLAADSSLAGDLVARFPQHSGFTMGAQLLAFALVDAAARTGEGTEGQAYTMDLMAARAGADKGHALRITAHRTA